MQENVGMVLLLTNFKHNWLNSVQDPIVPRHRLTYIGIGTEKEIGTYLGTK